MKKLIVWMFAIAALRGSELQGQNAQNLTGTWQGALKSPNGQLRIVIKISLAEDRLRAVLYSIDQQSPPIPASTITSDGSTVKMTVAALNGNYEGKLSADGNSIAGTWSQGGPPAPLNFARATSETAWAIPEPPPPPTRMAASANPAFEVATIKPSNPSRPGKLYTVRGVEVVTINTTLSDLNLNVTNATMAQFVSLLQGAVQDRPVADQTRLTEKYDFILKWTPDQGQLAGLGGAPPPPPDTADAPPDLFTAIQQQLGLRLDSTRAPVDVLVIDRVERPSEN